MKYWKLSTDDAALLLPLLAPEPVLLEVDAPGCVRAADDPASAVAVLFLGGLNLLVPTEGPVGTELVVVGGADAEAEADALPLDCCKFRINMQ